MLEWMLPAWWDFATIVRLALLVPMIIAWGAVGFMLAPWAEQRFLTNTAGYVTWMVETFDKMFMEVSARACVLMIMASMAVSVFLGLLVTAGLPYTGGYHALRIVVVIVLVIGPRIPTGYNFPRALVNFMWERRVSAFEALMLDALAFMSNGLKSGLSLVQCMDMVREELPNPIAEEFGLVLSEQRLGVPLEEAMLNLEARINTEDLQIMVTSVNILRQSGGNLSETFDTIAETIRERRKVEGRIRSLTAQGVSQGVIIVALPFVLGGVLYAMDQELMSRLWTTVIGWGMLSVMVGLQVVGAVMIKKIVQIRV